MANADKYQKALELARRAGALEQQLADTKKQLESLAGELATDIPMTAGSTREEAVEMTDNDEPKASLTARTFAVFRKHPGKEMSAADVAKALNVVTKKQVNLISTYLTRLNDRGQLKRTDRGNYVWVNK